MNQRTQFDQNQESPAQENGIEIDLASLTKVYYSITEVANLFAVNASLLRFWEKEFPEQLANVKKNKKGDRYYNKKDIETLQLLFHLVKVKKMTLDGARQFLKDDSSKAKDELQLLTQLQQVKQFLLDIKKQLHKV